MTLSQAAFERAVRRLHGEDAREFVAGLLDARGYRTTVDGPVVIARRETGGSGESTGTGGGGGPEGTEESIRFRVVDGLRAVLAVGPSVRADAVVVTGGPLVAAVGAVVARPGPKATDGPALLGAGTLYEWFAYAVDTETRAALAGAYLDATEPSTLERGRSALGDALDDATTRLGRLPRPSGRTAGVVLLALLALVAVTTAGQMGLLTSTGRTALDDGGTPTPRLTAVPAAVASTPDTPDGPPLPDACPSPPPDAHPASLRPGVIRTASADGLEGWRLLVTQNITEYEFDPNDQQLGPVPEVRHVAVFETQTGARLRLGLDRWESPALAETVVARGGPWSLGFPWGTYGVWVELQSGGERGESAARELLAAVRTPGGVGLGGACVSALATATNATA